MNPKVWGPCFWFVLHTISLNYPENPSHLDKRKYFDFFNNLQYILPCEVCRDNYKKKLDNLPIIPYLDSKENLIRWVIAIHNSVNKENGKKEMSFQEFKDKYQKIYKNDYLRYELISDEVKGEIEKEEEASSYKSNLFICVVLLLIIYFYLYSE